MGGLHHGAVEVDVRLTEAVVVIRFRRGAATVECVLELVEVGLVPALGGQRGGRHVEAASDFDRFERVCALEAFAQGDFLFVDGGNEGAVALPGHEESGVHQGAEGFPERSPAEAQRFPEFGLGRNPVSEAPFALSNPQPDVVNCVVDHAASAVHRHGVLISEHAGPVPGEPEMGPPQLFTASFWTRQCPVTLPLAFMKRLTSDRENPPFRKTSYECIFTTMTQITQLLPDTRLPGTGDLPATRLGVQFTRYPGYEDRPLQDSFRAAVDDGFTLVVLNSIAAELSAGATTDLRDVADAARQAGVELQLGLGCAGPFGDPATVRESLLEALLCGTELGIKEFFVYTRSVREGAEEEGRFLDHPAQLRLIRANLEALASAALSAKVRINVKTHEDLASPEVLALVRELDPAVFGIGLDVANLVVRGEDPVDVARALGTHVRMTHLEDAVLFPVEEGYRRRLRAIGEGVFDWDGILRNLLDAGVRDFTLEQHRGKFDTPVFDRSWFDHEPHLNAAGLAQVARLGVATHDGVARGRFPALADWDEEPGAAERRRQLLHSASTLRRLLTSIRAGANEPAPTQPGEERLP